MKIEEIKIESGVPLPSMAERWVQLLRGMKVGESFVIPERSKQNVYNAAKKNEIRIVTRRNDDGLVRVWRLE